ncbi:uncharacterized protein LOC128860719 [Anastrepha ludens]|uniref:uncharacterized protein LOC128860719 n=1 Tax=Anastrepha ludens TaxID=28586 RepID=UPI0023B00170|nr:uncharacterized protein LOC128860719 [Anastrepha ludens]
MSRLTLQKSFFDNLWPLILSDNVCDTLSKNLCRFYEPDQPFDNVWLHAYLADRSFKNYQPPKVIRCCFDDKEEKLVLSETSVTNGTELRAFTPNIKTGDELSKQSVEEEEELYSPKIVDISPIDQRIAALNENFDNRRRLAFAFINRQYPWYMQPPEYDAHFELTDNIRKYFNSKLEQAIIQDMHRFNCKLMIIDLAEQMCLHEMQLWLKFGSYAFMIVVARSEDAVKQIKLMGTNLSAVMLVENMEYTWQEQLTESLRVGLAHAAAMGIFENCMKSFVFVFSRNRHSCNSNAYRVLRKT